MHVLPIPQILHAECELIIERCAGLTPDSKLNMYSSTIYPKPVSVGFRAYFRLREHHRVTVETVLKSHMPTHKDVLADVEGFRWSHCVLNCESKPIEVTVEECEFVLPSWHWFVLNSQTPHSAICEPPHSILGVDGGYQYTEYCELLGV